MEPIKQRPQQLLAVLLPIPSKLGTPFCNLGLEFSRSNIADVALHPSKEGAQSPMSRGIAVLGLQVMLLCTHAQGSEAAECRAVHIGPSAVLWQQKWQAMW